MEKIRNFRILAPQIKNNQGQFIKDNMIYRSGNLSHASDTDLNKIKNLGIQRIYDLRSSIERDVHDTRLDIEILHFNVSNSDSKQPMDKDFLIKVANSGADEFMMMLYRDYLPFSPILKPLFQHIIQEKTPFLFHCAAGKDRTGIVGALLMFILDFDEDAIIDEYVKLDIEVLHEAEEGLNKIHGLSDELIELLKPMNGVNKKYIEVFIKTIKEKYGSIQAYIETFLGLSSDLVLNFRKNYMTK